MGSIMAPIKAKMAAFEAIEDGEGLAVYVAIKSENGALVLKRSRVVAY